MKNLTRVFACSFPRGLHPLRDCTKSEENFATEAQRHREMTVNNTSFNYTLCLCVSVADFLDTLDPYKHYMTEPSPRGRGRAGGGVRVKSIGAGG